MQFNADLYWALTGVYPELTVRSLSRLMGRSEGYWSSVNSQNLPVSCAALVQLLDALAIQKIFVESRPAKKKKINEVEELINAELMARFNKMTGIDHNDLCNSSEEDSSSFYDFMPFIVSSF